MYKVLLTGCTGTIGSGITERLLELGFTVFGVSNQKTCTIRHEKHFCQSLDLLHADAEKLVDSVKPDILVHTSWVTDHQQFWESNLNEPWVSKSFELARAFLKNPDGYFLGIGSCAEYDDSVNEPLKVGIHEGPKTQYGVSKLKTLGLIKETGVNFGWGRVFYQYTLGSEEKKIISTLYQHARKDEKFTIQNPKNRFDFVFKDDVIENLVRMIIFRHSGVVNFGSGRSETIGSIAKLIEERVGKELFTLLDTNEALIKNVVADVSDQHILGFRWRTVCDVLQSSPLWQQES
jgi:nucleoside-diphosphate-sugar epimerase